jgi:hypothetical protein
VKNILFNYKFILCECCVSQWLCFYSHTPLSSSSSQSPQSPIAQHEKEKRKHFELKLKTATKGLVLLTPSIFLNQIIPSYLVHIAVHEHTKLTRLSIKVRPTSWIPNPHVGRLSKSIHNNPFFFFFQMSNAKCSRDCNHPRSKRTHMYLRGSLRMEATHSPR